MFVVQVMPSCVKTKKKVEKSQRDEISVRRLNVSGELTPPTNVHGLLEQ